MKLEFYEEFFFFLNNLINSDLLKFLKIYEFCDMATKNLKFLFNFLKNLNNKKNSDKSNYAIYGFMAFCVLLGVLFILKKQKSYKTEFE